MNPAFLDTPSDRDNNGAPLTTPEFSQEQFDTELASLREQLESLREEGDQLIAEMYDAPITKAISEMPEDSSKAYYYTMATKHSYRIFLQGVYATPGKYAQDESYTYTQLYDDLKEMHPHFRLEASVHLVKQIQEHIGSISPKKRDRIAQHPEQWNYAALAKKSRQQFIAACDKPLVADDSDLPDTYQENFEALETLLQMTAVYSLMSQDPTIPLSEENKRDRQRKFLDQTFMPVYEDKVRGAFRDGTLAQSLMSSYREAFTYSPIDFAAIQKLNGIAGDKAQQYIKYIMIEDLAQTVSSQYADVTDIQTMQTAYLNLFKTIHTEGGAAYLADADISLKRLNEELTPQFYDVQDRIIELEQQAPQTSTSELDAEQLDWEVLPPGDLEKIAREIVHSARSEKHTPTIDLERLTVLENIRTRWGEDDCYYARGALSARRTVRSGNQSEADQYLMLILQEKDSSGSVTAEHAIAESPIAGPNALYVFRQDVSENLHWRDVMSLPKSYARDFGARVVKHTLPRGETDLIGAMTEKVSTLMSATPEEFQTMQFNGARGIRLTRNVLRLALQSEPTATDY